MTAPHVAFVAEGRETRCITFLQSHKPPLQALSVARRAGSGLGSPNAVLERLLDAPATTRAWRTIERLVGR
jgi:hypothetical protein